MDQWEPRQLLDIFLPLLEARLAQLGVVIRAADDSLAERPTHIWGQDLSLSVDDLHKSLDEITARFLHPAAAMIAEAMYRTADRCAIEVFQMEMPGDTEWSYQIVNPATGLRVRLVRKYIKRFRDTSTAFEVMGRVCA